MCIRDRPNTDVPIQAGDLKYKDLNGDGVINDFDKGAIGKPNLPNTTPVSYTHLIHLPVHTVENVVIVTACTCVTFVSQTCIQCRSVAIYI